MSITSDISNQKLTISISGGFDFSSHKDFRAATDLIKSSHVTHVCVDMRTTDYIDSSALGMLLILNDKMDKTKGSISIVNSKPDVRKILDIANFGQLFTLA